MKNIFLILLSTLVLCSCSKKQPASTGPAIELVQAGKDTTWRDGYVLHVSKRDGTSVQGVSISKQLPTGQTTTISADTATLSRLPNATNGDSVVITFHQAHVGGNAVPGDLPFALHK